MCGIVISRLILSDPIFAICTMDDDEVGLLYVDDGSDSGGVIVHVFHVFVSALAFVFVFVC